MLLWLINRNGKNRFQADSVNRAKSRTVSKASKKMNDKGFTPKTLKNFSSDKRYSDLKHHWY
ncbi:hypothetical protein LCGC14_1422770 [marine sediment metagenome]|uniref:Uncharacterized protein n=1 Tax=marine sediment metagenome TaxID=412755 RepID=A0A0F9MSJ7_9ZZZZ